MVVHRTDEEIVRAFDIDALCTMFQLHNAEQFCNSVMRRVSSLVTDADLELLKTSAKHQLVLYAERTPESTDVQLKREIAETLFTASLNKVLRFYDEHNCITLEEIEFKSEIAGSQLKDQLRPDYYNDSEGNFEDFNPEIMKPLSSTWVYNYVKFGHDRCAQYLKLLVDITRRYHVWNLVDVGIAEVVAAHIDRFTEEKCCARAIALDRLLFGSEAKCLHMRLAAVRKELQDILDVLGLDHSFRTSADFPDDDWGLLVIKVKGSQHEDDDLKDAVLSSDFRQTWSIAFNQIVKTKQMIAALQNGQVRFDVRHDGSRWRCLKRPLSVPKFTSVYELALKLAATNCDDIEWSIA